MTSRVDTFLRSSSDFYNGVFSTTKKQEKVGRVGQRVWLVKTEQKGHVIEDGLSSRLNHFGSVNPFILIVTEIAYHNRIIWCKVTRSGMNIMMCFLVLLFSQDCFPGTRLQ